MLFSRAIVASSSVCCTNLVDDSMFLILFVYQLIRSFSVKDTFFIFSRVPVNNLNLSDSHQSSSLKILDSNNETCFAEMSQTGNKFLNS